MRSLGVSNYAVEDFQELMASATVTPAINQIEINPFLYRKNTIGFFESQGVKLQSYREGGLRDATVFAAETGATWIDPAGRTRVWGEWRDWLGRRAGAGKLAPKGFPTSKRFKPK